MSGFARDEEGWWFSEDKVGKKEPNRASHTAITLLPCVAFQPRPLTRLDRLALSHSKLTGTLCELAPNTPEKLLCKVLWIFHTSSSQDLGHELAASLRRLGPHELSLGKPFAGNVVVIIPEGVHSIRTKCHSGIVSNRIA